jgi:hypothetical protein
MDLRNIPNEIFEAALEYEGIESWGLERAAEAYKHETFKRGYTDGGLEKALSDYLLKQNDFAENARFEHAANNGWSF